MDLDGVTGQTCQCQVQRKAALAVALNKELSTLHSLDLSSSDPVRL
jgi:hypothetical protein